MKTDNSKHNTEQKPLQCRNKKGANCKKKKKAPYGASVFSCASVNEL